MYYVIDALIQRKHHEMISLSPLQKSNKLQNLFQLKCV